MGRLLHLPHGPRSLHLYPVAGLRHPDAFHLVEHLQDVVDGGGTFGHKVDLVMKEGSVEECDVAVVVAPYVAHDLQEVHVVIVEEAVAPVGIAVDVGGGDGLRAVFGDAGLLSGRDRELLAGRGDAHAAADEGHLRLLVGVGLDVEFGPEHGGLHLFGADDEGMPRIVGYVEVGLAVEFDGAVAACEGGGKGETAVGVEIDAGAVGQLHPVGVALGDGDRE